MPLLAEDDPEALQACWEALGAVTASIPKEMQPSFVRCLKVRARGVAGACGAGSWLAVAWVARARGPCHAPLQSPSNNPTAIGSSAAPRVSNAATHCPPRPMHPSSPQEAVLTARDKERRKRRRGALLVPGFCLPKALGPVLPIYLQGVLQVG